MEGITTRQPEAQINRADADNILKQMDIQKVREWSEEDVNTNFLTPLGFSYAAKIFKEHKINGPCLINITEEHLKELGAFLLGDRLSFMEFLTILKKKKRQLDRSATLWSGMTPHISCSYSDNLGQFLFRYFCRCCVPKTEWRVTAQGLRYTSYPATIALFKETERDFIDFRFLKDLEIRTAPTCMCCCRGHELLIYADDSSEKEVGKARDDPIIINHPDAIKLEETIRNAWAEARLVD